MAAVAIGAYPSMDDCIKDWVTPLLGVIMFGMGLTLKPHDFALVAKRPLPVIIGVQLLLQAMNFDVLNVPSRPIHPYLRAIQRMEAEDRHDA